MRDSSAPVRPAAPGRDLTIRDLTDSQRRLVGLLQRVRFGRIHRLRVRAGQPVLDGTVAWTRTVKVNGENGPHPAAGLEEFALRQETAAFLRQLHEVGDGEVANIEVRNGLPFTFEVVGSLAD